MEINIDRESRTPPHVQLADHLRRLIKKGKIPPGRRIPSNVEIEQATGLARDTIRKATNKLKDEGLVENVPGMGLYVVDPEEQA